MPELTKLKPGQEIAYSRWKANNKIEESDDYDMKGYWKDKGFQTSKHDGHFPDTYKLKAPFSEGDRYQQISDESKYSGNPSYLTGNNTSFDKRGQGTWLTIEDKNNKPIIGPGDREDKFEGYAKGTQSISVLSTNTRIPSNLMKEPYKMKMKMKYKQKAARGLQDVAVPQAGSDMDVLSGAANGAATGASIAGPWGAVAGGVIMGGAALLNKGEQDRLNKEALERNANNKMNRRFDGTDNTVDQKSQVYKKGAIKMKKSKVVEAEHKEHVFDSEMNHKGVVMGKTHKEGGEDIEVEEGDSIFPAKHKSVIDKALSTGNIRKINQIKKKLPTDTKNGKAALGLNGDPEVPDPIAYKKRDKSIKPVMFDNKPLFANDLNRKGQYGAYQEMVAGYDSGDSTWMDKGAKGNPFPYAVGKNKAGNMYRDDNMPGIKPIVSTVSGGVSSTATPISTTLAANAPTSSVGSTGSAVGDSNNEQSPIGNIGKYANLANNVFQALKPAPTVDQSYLDPELLKYQDTSESLRRQSRQAETVMGANARNGSGGMVGNLRSNQQAASVDNLDRQDTINEREVQKSGAIDNQNVGIKNSAKQINLTRKDGYQDIMDRNRASSEAYAGAAAKEITDQANVNEQTSYLKSRDAKLDAVDQQKLAIDNQRTMYTIDAQGNKVFNKNSSGGSMSSGSGVTKSVTTKEDKEGKTSSSTTVKTGAPKQSSSRSSSSSSGVFSRISRKRK